MSGETPEIAAARFQAERARAQLMGTAQRLQTRLSPGTLARSLPFLQLMRDVDGITTDEDCLVDGGRVLQAWHQLRFAQRHQLMSSMGLGRRLLAMTGRMSIYRGSVAVDPSFIPLPIDPPSIPCIASADPGTVSPGTLSGANAIPRPRTSSSTAIPRLATVFHGSSFSIAIRAAMNAIQPRLITPSANSAAIKAQQQPMHQPPWTIPIRRLPSRPACQCCIRNANGLRQWRRQTSFQGVSW